MLDETENTEREEGKGLDKDKKEIKKRRRGDLERVRT